MKLTKTQKTPLILTAIGALLLAILVIIPFKTIFDNSNIFRTEVLIKLVLLPFLVGGLSIYPILKRYDQIKRGKQQSVVISIMSYLPITLYLGGLIINALYMLTRGVEPLGEMAWVLWFTILLVTLILLLGLFKFFPRYELRLTFLEHATLDVCIFAISLCYILMYYQILKAYHPVMLLVNSKQGDPFLLIFYIISSLILYFVIKAIINLFSDDEFVILARRINQVDYQATSENQPVPEDNHTEDQQAGLKEVEEVKIEVETIVTEETDLNQTEADLEPNDLEETVKEVEEIIEEATEDDEEYEEIVEDVEPEIIEQYVEETQVVKETIVKPIVHENLVVEIVKEERFISPETDQIEEVNALKNNVDTLQEQLTKDENKVNEIESEIEKLQKLVDDEIARVAEEERIKAEEKRLRLEKKMERVDIVPSINDLIKYAETIPNVTFKTKGTKTQLLVNKKMFMTITDAYKEYRIMFFPTDDSHLFEVLDLLKSSRAKRKEYKGLVWVMFTNKGQLTEEVLHDIITRSAGSADKYYHELKLLKKKKSE